MLKNTTGECPGVRSLGEFWQSKTLEDLLGAQITAATSPFYWQGYKYFWYRSGRKVLGEKQNCLGSTYRRVSGEGSFVRHAGASLLGATAKRLHLSSRNLSQRGLHSCSLADAELGRASRPARLGSCQHRGHHQLQPAAALLTSAKVKSPQAARRSLQGLLRLTKCEIQV